MAWGARNLISTQVGADGAAVRRGHRGLRLRGRGRTGVDLNSGWRGGPQFQGSGARRPADAPGARVGRGLPVIWKVAGEGARGRERRARGRALLRGGGVPRARRAPGAPALDLAVRNISTNLYTKTERLTFKPNHTYTRSIARSTSSGPAARRCGAATRPLLMPPSAVCPRRTRRR